MYSKSKKHGFTLVELIVVLTILAILAALIIPSLIGYIGKAKKDKIIAETRMLHESVQTVTSELYGGATQWKVSNTSGGNKTLASSTGRPAPLSSFLDDNIKSKERYDETVKLSEVHSLQDDSGHFFAMINGDGQVHCIIYTARGYLGVYFSDTKQYAAYKIGETTEHGTITDAYASYYGTVYYIAAIDKDNSNDPTSSYIWSCASIRATLGIGSFTP